MLARLQSCAAAAAMDAWLGFVSDCTVAKDRAWKTLARLMFGVAGGAFRSWVGWRDERQRMQRVAKRCITQMAKRGVACAFQAWAETLNEQARRARLLVKVLCRKIPSITLRILLASAWCDFKRRILIYH